MTLTDQDWDWHVANDTPPWRRSHRIVYFLTRIHNGRREDLLRTDGRLREWRTYHGAIAALTRLRADYA